MPLTAYWATWQPTNNPLLITAGVLSKGLTDGS